MKWTKESRKKRRMEGGEKEDRRGERRKGREENEVCLTSSVIQLLSVTVIVILY